jgi:DNA-binding transcriptional ArsR family regulator
MNNMTKDEENKEQNALMKKLEEMDNKLERIKSDTNSLNRVACLSNSDVIVKELRKAVGESGVRAAILHLSKDETSAANLVKTLGIKEQNLAKYMKPFLGNKGIIAELRKGRKKYFQRSELVDLVGFENDEAFAKLLNSWKEKRTKEEGVQPKEETNVT